MERTVLVLSAVERRKKFMEAIGYSKEQVAAEIKALLHSGHSIGMEPEAKPSLLSFGR